MLLTAENVDTVFKDCLFKDDEIEEGRPKFPYTEAQGITMRIGFHTERLQGHKEDIHSMLKALPKEFMEGTGGGWTFLNACNDCNDVQWTGEHRRMEQLFLLGLAIEKVKCMMPREIWNTLPGGVPYYMVLK